MIKKIIMLVYILFLSVCLLSDQKYFDRKFFFFHSNVQEFKEVKKISEALLFFRNYVIKNQRAISTTMDSGKKSYSQYSRHDTIEIGYEPGSFEVYRIGGKSQKKYSYSESYYYLNKEERIKYFIAIIDKSKGNKCDLYFEYQDLKKATITIVEYYKTGSVKYYIEECVFNGVQEYKVQKTNKIYR